MSRHVGSLLAVGSGMVLVGLIVLAALSSVLQAPAGEAERVERIAAGLRCPDCQALSVAESRTAAAAAIREQITALVAEGRSDDEIRRHFVDRYGAWILLAPNDPLAWWLPGVVVAGAVVAFGLWLRAGAGGASPQEPPPTATDEERARRVREELEALDG